MKITTALLSGVICTLFFSAAGASGTALAQAGDLDRQLPPAYRPVEPGQDKLGGVTGTNIDMKTYDHTVAGAINGGVAWGYYDEAGGFARLVMRKYSQVITAEFKKQDGKLGGTISSTDGSSTRTTRVEFAGANVAARTFRLLINGEPVAVSIQSEGMNGEHFVNPAYSAVVGGKPVSYRIEAEGCMGYSIFMGMLMFGAYAH